jgi:membrane protein required for colicin V production
MTGLDLVFIALVLALTGRGIWRGFINDLSGLLGLVLGYLFAGPLSEHVEPFLEAFIDSAGLRHGVAYYLSLFVLYLAVVFLGKIATQLSKIILLGWLNRVLGALSGLAKGLFIAALVALPLRWFGDEFPSIGPGAEYRASSSYYSKALAFGEWLTPNLFRVVDGLDSGEDAAF